MFNISSGLFEIQQEKWLYQWKHALMTLGKNAMNVVHFPCTLSLSHATSHASCTALKAPDQAGLHDPLLSGGGPLARVTFSGRISIAKGITYVLGRPPLARVYFWKFCGKIPLNSHFMRIYSEKAMKFRPKLRLAAVFGHKSNMPFHCICFYGTDIYQILCNHIHSLLGVWECLQC